MSNQVSKSERFVNEMIGGMPTTQAKIHALSVFAKYAGDSIYLPTQSKSSIRSRAAKNMLANGMDASEIISALVSRFGISARTANRDVSSARKTP